MGGLSPGEEANESILKDEDNSYTGIEPPEVVGHQR